MPPVRGAETGRLILIIGASGCGKDHLLRGARTLLDSEPRMAFAHRYITRAADGGGENHIELTEGEFASRRAAGLFALHWDSHGLRYGLGVEIDAWMARGFTVVANGSRGHLHACRARYPELVAIEIVVPPAQLRQRLLQRGRETADEIERRLARSAVLANHSDCRPDIRIDNGGPPEHGCTALCTAIRDLRTANATASPAAPCA